MRGKLSVVGDRLSVILAWLRRLATMPARLRDMEKRIELQRKLNANLVRECANLRSAAESPVASEGVAGLSLAEVERLALMGEVCGRVAAEVGWILREGWVAPPDGKPPRVAMERELGRVRCVINLMYDAGDVRGTEMKVWQSRFRATLARTTRHQVFEERPAAEAAAKGE